MPFNSNHDNETRSKKHRMPELPEVPVSGVTHLPTDAFRHRKTPAHDAQQYIVSGDRNHMPQFNATELAVINHLRTNPELLGNGIGKFFKKMGKDINKSNRKIEKQFVRAGDDLKHAANVTGDALEKSATDKKGILRNLISASLDVGLPMLGEVAAAGVGLPPGVGKAVGTIGRKTLKGTTGYGIASGVGVYKGGSKSTIKSQVQAEISRAIDQYLPEAQSQTVMGSGAIAKPPKKKVNTGRADRNAIVKKIMLERNVSLPVASKIVKAENLY
jgi:hypothetical protein